MKFFRPQSQPSVRELGAVVNNQNQVIASLITTGRKMNDLLRSNNKILKNMHTHMTHNSDRINRLEEKMASRMADDAKQAPWVNKPPEVN